MSLITFENEIKINDLDNPKILVVDDTVFNVEIIKMLMKQLFNLEIDYSYSGSQAI